MTIWNSLTLTKYLADEETVLEEDESLPKLELKAKIVRVGKEQENQLCIKEVKLRERKLSIHLKIMELKLAKTATNSAGLLEKFDISKHIYFIPPF